MLIFAIVDDGFGSSRLIGEGNNPETAFNDLLRQDEGTEFNDVKFFAVTKLEVRAETTYTIIPTIV